MKVITAVKKYLKTDREIFLQCDTDGTVILRVDKDKDFNLQFGERIANAKAINVDEDESPDAVTIYLK